MTKEQFNFFNISKEDVTKNGLMLLVNRVPIISEMIDFYNIDIKYGVKSKYDFKSLTLNIDDYIKEASRICDIESIISIESFKLIIYYYTIDDLKKEDYTPNMILLNKCIDKYCNQIIFKYFDFSTKIECLGKYGIEDYMTTYDYIPTPIELYLEAFKDPNIEMFIELKFKQNLLYWDDSEEVITIHNEFKNKDLELTYIDMDLLISNNMIPRGYSKIKSLTNILTERIKEVKNRRYVLTYLEYLYINNKFVFASIITNNSLKKFISSYSRVDGIQETIYSLC